MEREEAETPYPSMQVLFVVDSLNVGGAERHVIDLASAFAQRGHGVTLACSAVGALAPLAAYAGVEVRPLLCRLVKRRPSVRYAWELARLFHRDRFDLSSR